MERMAEGEALVTSLAKKFIANALPFNEKKWRDPLIWITPCAGYTLKPRLVAFSEPPSEATWLENAPF